MELLPAELVTRVIATAVIVIGVTMAVERLGPLLGGALVGLPIVIGPGFYFLIRQSGPEFSAEAAASSLISLGATEAFLLAYCAAARRRSAAASIAAATGAWLAAALLLSHLPPRPLPGLVVFAVAAVAARRIGRRFLRHGARRGAKGSPLLLLIRGLAAGMLVAAATLAAGRLGAGWSGFVMTYPIGFTVVAITIHQRLGADTAIATLHAAMLGVASLAAFSGTLAVTIVRFGPVASFATAMVAGVAVTTVLAWRSARSVGRTA